MRNQLTHMKISMTISLALALFLSALVSPAQAMDRQYKVEAAFLYNFFNYITWPGYESPQDLEKPMVCVYGDDPIVPYLEYIQLKMAFERKIALRKVWEEKEAHGCHMLFLRHRISYQWLMHSAENKTLTVFKPDDPLDRGGMIELSEEGERLAIKLNQNQLTQNGFQVSSRLLELVEKGR